MKKIEKLNNEKRVVLAVVSFCFLPYGAAYGALEGKLEAVNCEQVKGWAWNSASPTTRVSVEIYDVSSSQAKLLATLTAQNLRTDLRDAGKGDGNYGFSYWLPARVRNATKHKISVRFKGASTELSRSPKTTAWACYGRLNDTGIQHCSNQTSITTCSVTSYQGQDAHYGRDAKALAGQLVKQGEGTAGFDFTKIANDGSALPAYAALGAGAKDWACTLDNVTGLMWEVKTDDGGLRDKDNTYSWYDPNATSNGGFSGYQNQGVCEGDISCDTEGYTAAVNDQKLCGKSDWRVPKRLELYSIENYGRRELDSAPLDVAYFLSPVGDGYWSSTTLAGYNGNAWTRNPVGIVVAGLVLGVGDDGYGIKSDGHALRLVRSGQ